MCWFGCGFGPWFGFGPYYNPFWFIFPLIGFIITISMIIVLVWFMTKMVHENSHQINHKNHCHEQNE